MKLPEGQNTHTHNKKQAAQSYLRPVTLVPAYTLSQKHGNSVAKTKFGFAGYAEKFYFGDL